MDSREKKIIAICGPTASGKTHRAVSIARLTGGEIISADSRQLYRGMDIGTGKDLEEYGDVSYHLIDIADAGYKYNLYEYVRDASKAIKDIEDRGKQVIICGGTGLYLEALIGSICLPEVPANETLRNELEGKSLEELKIILERMKKLHNVTDIDTKKRAIRAIEIQTYYNDHPETNGGKKGKERASVIIGVDIDREERRRRISERLIKRLDEGMIDEVKGLLDAGIPAEDLIYYGLEYKYLTLYLTGVMQLDEMVKSLEIAIHQFAKRQMTWFRGMERRGYKINWLSWDMSDEEFAERALELIREEQR